MYFFFIIVEVINDIIKSRIEDKQDKGINFLIESRQKIIIKFLNDTSSFSLTKEEKIQKLLYIWRHFVLDQDLCLIE